VDRVLRRKDHWESLNADETRLQRSFICAGHSGGMKTTSIGFGLLASLLLAGCGAGGSSTPNIPHSSGGGAATILSTAVIDGGPAFVDGAQHAVYTFDGDKTANQSTCTGQCAAVWPPLPPPTTLLVSPWASFTRTDGSQQLSYNGKPLYAFSGDSKPDVATGNGVNGFHLARPAAGTGNGVPPGNPGYNP
jgi:predicted lipoprotein with Yx(FWY)xxD motif